MPITEKPIQLTAHFPTRRGEDAEFPWSHCIWATCSQALDCGSDTVRIYIYIYIYIPKTSHASKKFIRIRNLQCHQQNSCNCPLSRYGKNVKILYKNSWIRSRSRISPNSDRFLPYPQIPIPPKSSPKFVDNFFNYLADRKKTNGCKNIISLPDVIKNAARLLLFIHSHESGQLRHATNKM